MVYQIEETEKRLKDIWENQKIIENDCVEQTKFILCSTLVCQDSITKLIKYCDSLKNPNFKKLLFNSPLISTYIEDILIKSLKQSDRKQEKTLEIYAEIKNIIVKGYKDINLNLWDHINYYLQLLPYKSKEVYEIETQINDQFKKIAKKLKLKPYQFKPIYKFTDLFQQEECDQMDDYNISYAVIKESVIQGLRRAAISLIQTGCNQINPHETRLVTVYSNVRPLNHYVGKFDFKFMVQIRLTEDLYNFMRGSSRKPNILEMQKKQYLKSESLILMTNLQLFAYFEIIDTIWDDLRQPIIEMKPLDLQSIINYTRMLNTRHQNLILESKSQHFRSYKYLEYLIEQSQIPYLSTQIIECIQEGDYFKIEEIETSSNKEQQNYIANNINDKVNVVFSYPNTNEQDILGEIVKRQMREVEKILIICQTPKINEILTSTSVVSARSDVIRIDYIKKGNQINKESKKNEKFSHIFKGEFEQLLDDLLIPNYKVSPQELKIYSKKLFKLIVKQYAQINNLKNDVCIKCQDYVAEQWIRQVKYDTFELNCKCLIQIGDKKQNQIKRQNQGWKQFAKNPVPKLLQDRKTKKLFKPQLKQNNLKQLLQNNDQDDEQEEQHQNDQNKNTSNLRLMRMRERFNNLRGFAKQYREYEDTFRGDFLHGIDVEKQKIKNLLNGEHFVWAFEPSDRNYVMTEVYYKRYLQNLATFQYYYKVLNKTQQKNRKDKEKENFMEYKGKVLLDSMTNISRNLGLIDQLREYSLIVYGANRFLQGHVNSYIRNGKIKRVIFIGDEHQLDTNVYIDNNIYGKFALKSHFKIISEFINFHNFNKLSLTVQTKATKGLFEICKLFYPKLRNRNDEQSEVKGVAKHIQFIQHEYLEQINNKIQIIQNYDEADFVIQFARYLVLSGNDQKDICIIAFTQQQKFDIETQLMDKKLQNIQVGAPIYFDGLYKKIVIISLVRSNTYKKIGVLRNYTKLISALTRAQKALFVFGNFQMILDAMNEIHLSEPNDYNKKSLEIFNSLIQYGEKNNILNHYLEIKYKYGQHQIVDQIEYWQKLEYIINNLSQIQRLHNRRD